MTGEIRPLTGIRGLAAASVMLYHYGHSPTLARSGLLFPAKGYLCVDLFFVLSGFVLALRYGGAFAGGATAADLRGFARARFARIYPAYAAITALYLAKYAVNASGTHPGAYPAADLAANALLIQSWGLPVSPIIYDSWSVSAEWFAYLLFPPLVMAVLGRGRAAAALCGLGAAGALAGIAASRYGVNGPLDAYRDDGSLVPLLRCLAGFTLGVAACAARRAPLARRLLGAGAAPAALVALVGASLWLDPSDVVTVLLLAPLVAALSFDRPAAAALFGNRLLHHLGAVSYSLYLLHPLVLSVAERAAAAMPPRLGPGSAAALAALGGVGATWLLSWASFRLIERPAGRALRGRAPGRRAALAAGAP